MNHDFAQNLLRLRKSRGLTQEQLAGQLGVSPQSVSKWENCQSYPDIELLPRLAAAFSVRIDALLGYRSEKLRTSQYESKYRDPAYYWGNDVWSGCYEVLRLMPPVRPLRLLDVGCGEGQAAVFFARNGYTVSAFDVTASGIEKGRQLAELHRTEVDFFQADLLNYQPESTFDIVFSSGVLQYIPPADRRRVLESYKSCTAVGGIHVLNVFVDKPFLPVPPDWEEQEYFWTSGELLNCYHDWKVEQLEERIFDCHSSGIPHRHCMDVLIARKMV